VTAADELPADSAGWPPAIIALDLARQCVAEWRAIGAAASQAERDDPGFGKLQAEIRGAGRQQIQAAQLAAWFAQVSIAEDLHRLADLFANEAWFIGRPAADLDTPTGDGEPPP
jgi:hypothetical protein